MSCESGWCVSAIHSSFTARAVWAGVLTVRRMLELWRGGRVEDSREPGMVLCDVVVVQREWNEPVVCRAGLRGSTRRVVRGAMYADEAWLGRVLDVRL